jgi:hypothetical protein
MSVVNPNNSPPATVKVSPYHVRYKLHVFHPRSKGHAGTLQLDTKWEGVADAGLNSAPLKGTKYEYTWNWIGSPYGTLKSAFHLSVTRWHLYQPKPGPITQIMILESDRWDTTPPLHPWFAASDKIILKDPNFVAAPQKARGIVLPEDPVALTWTCKLLKWESETGPGSAIP